MKPSLFLFLFLEVQLSIYSANSLSFVSKSYEGEQWDQSKSS